MRIFALNLKNENMLAANMSMLPVHSLEELKKVTSIALPDLILIPEEHAEEFIAYMKQLPDIQLGDRICEIIVLIDQVEDANIATVREWTAKGAKSAWLKEDWEEQLMEQYGQSESATGDQRSKRFNGNQPIVIAVGSSFKGAGSTHTALAIGKYLQKQYKAKVAIIECGKDAKDFSHIKLAGVGINASLRFVWERLTFICGGLDAVSLEVATRTDQFDYIVLDMGDLNRCEVSHLFFSADLPLLVGSPRIWRVASIYEVLASYSNYPQEDVRIVLSSGSEADCKLLRASFEERIVLNLPHQPDPFKWVDQTEACFEKILSPVLPIKRKKFLSILS